MCRDIAIDIINGILEDIYDNADTHLIREKCEEFKKTYFYEDLKIDESEIRKDRLKEYIRFFNISGICEYDIFESEKIFYKILEENLEEEEKSDIKRFLDAGGILQEYKI